MSDTELIDIEASDGAAGDAAQPGSTEPAAASVAVRAQQLTKRYGSLLAVNQLDLIVPRGSIFGLIGPNGAGKSTTFAMMATLLKPTSGRITVMGADPSVKPRTVRRRMGYMPDNLGVYDNLRVDEYIEFFAASYGMRFFACLSRTKRSSSAAATSLPAI